MLYTSVEADLTDHEGLTHANAFTNDHHAGKGLDTGVAVLLGLHVHVNGVTEAEGRDFLSRFHVPGVKSLNSVNHCFPSVLPHIGHRSGAIYVIAHRVR